MLNGYLRSSSFKMALLFTLLLCAAGAALGYINFRLNQQQFLESAERQINAEIRVLQMAQRSGQLQAEIALSTQKSDVLVLLTDKQNQYLAGNLSSDPENVQVLREGTLGFTRPDQHTYAARIHTFDDGRRLLVGLDITAASKEYLMLQRLGVISLILMAIVIATSFLISTFVVSRTNRIANTARQMMETGDLSRRIEIDSGWDDLSNMSHVLNLFLARLEELVHGVRQVSDNIAHDLRTPLTRLRNDLERLRLDATGRDDLQNRIDEMIADTDGLLGVFAALLRISRLETIAQTALPSAFDLADVLRDVCELYEPLAEAKELRWQPQLAPAPMKGDRDLVFQIFANLLDNAIKYTPAGGDIRIACGVQDGRVVAQVADTGPGIPAAERERVFERFYRLEGSRTSPGSGLGLALVRAAVYAQQGQIELMDAAPGLDVIVSFTPAA